ncbi:MAG: FAD-dependent monooxygenase [Burkholderiales bacterium]|nr:FAD-dependent monooxygenase [Burkholderiales bacterium]
MRILVVGSGIAGQTLACALAKRGIACDVVEVKPAFDIAGAGLYVQGPALRAFQDIGVVEAIVAAGLPLADDTSLVTDSAGMPMARPSYPRIAGPHIPSVVPIRRRALHEILARAVEAAGVAVRMGVTVDALAQAPDGVTATFSDGRVDRYDLVVGADGIRSRVRALLFPAAQPQYTGYANWRVILPTPAGLERTTWMMGTGTSFGIVPIAPGLVYIAGVSKEPGNPRFERAELPALCRSRFAEFGGFAPALLAQVTAPDQVVYTPIEEVRLAPPWHKGRVVLVGDAAHAGTPFWAMGATMAIEDAVLLATLLARGTPIEAVLPDWMARRLPRCRFVQDGSLQTGRRSHEESPEALAAREHYVRNLMVADVARRYATLAEPFVW